VSGSGINWAICKSEPRSRQITMPAPHHSVFTGRMPFLPPNKQRQSTEGWNQRTAHRYEALKAKIRHYLDIKKKIVLLEPHRPIGRHWSPVSVQPEFSQTPADTVRYGHGADASCGLPVQFTSTLPPVPVSTACWQGHKDVNNLHRVGFAAVPGPSLKCAQRSS